MSTCPGESRKLLLSLLLLLLLPVRGLLLQAEERGLSWYCWCDGNSPLVQWTLDSRGVAGFDAVSVRFVGISRLLTLQCGGSGGGGLVEVAVLVR